jgi:hypothetical protein
MDVWLLERLAGLARRGSCLRFLLATVKEGLDTHAFTDTVSASRIEEPTAREEARTNLKEQLEAADSSVRGGAVENVDLPTLQEWEDFFVDMPQSEGRLRFIFLSLVVAPNLYLAGHTGRYPSGSCEGGRTNTSTA